VAGPISIKTTNPVWWVDESGENIEAGKVNCPSVSFREISKIETKPEELDRVLYQKLWGEGADVDECLRCDTTTFRHQHQKGMGVGGKVDLNGRIGMGNERALRLRRLWG
jgi:hypothetical protein